VAAGTEAGPRGRISGERAGLVLAIASAAAFGSLAIFLKLADREGADPVAVLAVRFVGSAPLLWLLAIAAARRGPRRPLLPSARHAAGGLILGLAGYTAQAAFFQASVRRAGAALADLLLYAYPALVVLFAWLIGRERPTARRLGVLALATAGVALVLLGGAGTSFSAAGAAFGLAAALAYTLYILGSDSVVRGLHPLTLAALVTTGAALAYVGALLVRGGWDIDFSATTWGVLAGLVATTVFAISGFLGALRLIGPSRASILSTVEPVVTVVLAYAILGERLAPAQLAGGAMVVLACVLLQLRRGPAVAPEPAAGQSSPR